MLAGRDVTFHRVGRSYNRTVATVVLDGHDLGTELVQIGVAAWWPRGRPSRTGAAAHPDFGFDQGWSGIMMTKREAPPTCHAGGSSRAQ